MLYRKEKDLLTSGMRKYMDAVIEEIKTEYDVELDYQEIIKDSLVCFALKIQSKDELDKYIAWRKECSFLK